jgi:hypothetical protein
MATNIASSMIDSKFTGKNVEQVSTIRSTEYKGLVKESVCSYQDHLVLSKAHNIFTVSHPGRCFGTLPSQRQK